MTDMAGYLRPDGKVGVRNHVLVLATVSCVNGVIQRISREVPEAVCVPHAFGCGRGGVRHGRRGERNTGDALCLRACLKPLLPLLLAGPLGAAAAYGFSNFLAHTPSAPWRNSMSSSHRWPG